MAEIKVVGFQLGDEEYAVDIMKIDSVTEMLKIMKLPGLPVFVKGIANLRGEVIPILNTRAKFGLSPKENDSKDRIVIILVGKKKVGMIVDEVKEVLTLQQEQLEEPPSTAGASSARFISAIAKLQERMLIILDIDKILSEEEIIRLDKALERA
jgi:purine-binding chemotaxis protein CheW